MRIFDDQPIRFLTGEPLDPRDLNDTWIAAKDAADNLVDRRWQRFPLVVPFVESCGTPLTDATPLEARTFRFIAPVMCVLERAYLSAFLTSSAEVSIVLTSGGVGVGAAPLLTTVSDTYATGAISPFAVEVFDASNERITLVGGVEYVFTLTIGSGQTFTATRCDLILHLATDRFTNDANTDATITSGISPTLVTEKNARSASPQSANKAVLNAYASDLASEDKRGYACTLFQRFNTTSGTDVDVRAWSLPRFDSDRAASTALVLYAWVYFDANVTTTFDVIVRDQTGGASNLGSVTLTLTNQQIESGSAALAIPLSVATPGISADTAADYRVDFVSGSGTNARRAYALLWVAR